MAKKRITGHVNATHTCGSKTTYRVHTSPYKARKWGKEHGCKTTISKLR